MPPLPITDDAGVAQTLLPAAGMPSGSARLNRVRDRAMVVYSSAFGLGKRFVLMLCLMLPLFVVVGVASVYLSKFGLPRYAITGGMFLVAFVGSLGFMRWQMYRLRPRAPEIASMFLEEGICPCCGYNLAGVVAGHDERSGPRVVCSECGAAWARERIARTSEEETHDRRETQSLNVYLRNAGSVYASMAIVDAAGANRSMLRTVDLHAMVRGASDERRGRLRRGIGALRWRGVWLRLLVCALVVPLVLGGGYLVFRRPVNALRLTDLMALVMVGLWTLGIVAILRSDMGRTGKKRAAALVACDLCPVCAADLPSGDRRPCAECGAVWQDAKQP